MSVSFENGLATLRAQLDAPTAAFFSSCVRCGMCADACHFHVATGDPRYTPIHKLEPLRRLWRTEYTFWGRLLARMGLAKRVDAAMLDEWRELVYDSCTLCGRCSLVCPVGNDLAYMIRKLREGMVAAGCAPDGLKASTWRAASTGSPMGLKFPAVKKQLEQLAAEEGIDIPFDREGADYLLILSSNEIMLYFEGIVAMARIFHHAGLAWTLSSTGYEATNSGIQIGSSDIARQLLLRVVEAAEALGVKYVISPECGHAYMALRWEGPNLIGRPYRFEVVHVLELYARLQREGKLKLDGRSDTTFTFHDPCQLVRRGGVTEAPHALLREAVGEVRETDCSGKWNWCCGGGGGVSAIPEAEDLRAQAFTLKKRQFDASGAHTVVTACANCRTVLEDGVDANDMEIEITGLSEVLAAHLVAEREEPGHE